MNRILRPGASPPVIVPYCARCDMPVERLQFDVVSDPYRMGIHAQCCGATSSVRISIEEVYRLKRSNEKLYVISAKTHGPGIRGQKRRAA